MMKIKQVHEAFSAAMTNIKRTKKMENMKYPLTDKNKYRITMYFTNAEGAAYTDIIYKLMNRKKNQIIEAKGLFCFQYYYKTDGWFINDTKELSEYITDMFEDYYKKYVKPKL